MQSVLSLPPRLPDTLLSLFRTSPHHHEAIISVSLYWWKTEISFFFPSFLCLSNISPPVDQTLEVCKSSQTCLGAVVHCQLPTASSPWGCVGIAVATGGGS